MINIFKKKKIAPELPKLTKVELIASSDGLFIISLDGKELPNTLTTDKTAAHKFFKLMVDRYIKKINATSKVIKSYDSSLPTNHSA